MFFIPRYRIKQAPIIEMEPRKFWKRESFARLRRVKKMIGRSVRTGARATFTPAFMSCSRVSETTRASSGPGATPADRPNMIPAVRKVSMSVCQTGKKVCCIVPGKGKTSINRNSQQRLFASSSSFCSDFLILMKLNLLWRQELFLFFLQLPRNRRYYAVLPNILDRCMIARPVPYHLPRLRLSAVNL